MDVLNVQIRYFVRPSCRIDALAIIIEFSSPLAPEEIEIAQLPLSTNNNLRQRF